MVVVICKPFDALELGVVFVSRITSMVLFGRVVGFSEALSVVVVRCYVREVLVRQELVDVVYRRSVCYRVLVVLRVRRSVRRLGLAFTLVIIVRRIIVVYKFVFLLFYNYIFV